MAFGAATLITALGKAVLARRMIGATSAQAEPNYIGIGTGATAAARTAALADTALSAPAESRIVGTSSTSTTTVSNDTYQSVATFNMTAARSVDEAMMFDAASAGNSFFSSTFGVITLSIGDSLQLTCKTQFT